MAKTKWYKRWWAITIFVVFGFLYLVGIIAFIVDDGSSQIDTTNQNQEVPDEEPVKKKIPSGSVSIGEEGRLYREGNTVAHVCVTKEYFDELVDAVVANDEIGYKNLLYSPKCYVASTLDDYGKVLVLDKDWGATKFRFIYPDAIHYGETAWTWMEHIIPLE